MIEERKKEGKQGEENLRRTGSRADTDTDRQTGRVLALLTCDK